MHTRRVKAFDCCNRAVTTLTIQEAGVLVGNGYARWDGRAKKNIKFAVTQTVLVAFVGMMRHKPRAEARGLDSKTHLQGPGLANYKHIRNETYGFAGHRVARDPMDETAFAAYDIERVLLNFA